MTPRVMIVPPTTPGALGVRAAAGTLLARDPPLDERAMTICDSARGGSFMLGLRVPAVLALTVIALAGCRADQEAAEGIDMRPDPRIEQAPAYPTPPGEVPTGLQPDTSPMGPGDTIQRPIDDPTGAGAQPVTPP
jgi:hypothetical protein